MKKTIITLLIGLILGISMSVCASYLYSAKDIEYSNLNSEATNVKDALDELYDRDNCVKGVVTIDSRVTTTEGMVIEDKITPSYFSLYIDLTDDNQDQIIIYDSKLDSKYYLFGYPKGGSINGIAEVDRFYYRRDNSLIVHNWSSSYITSGGVINYVACK